MGHPTYPLSEQIKDTALAFGLWWTEWHYRINRQGPKLSEREWAILSLPARKAVANA